MPRRELEEALGRLTTGLSPEMTAELADHLGVTRREVEVAALERGLIPERYLRNLGTVGLDGQLALLQAAVAVVGLGGLGGLVLELLARMGVGRLLAVDADRFEPSNLNRQLLATEDDLGRPKPEAAVRRAGAVNSAVTVVPCYDRAGRANLAALLQGVAVAVDALDNLPDRYLLQEACSEAKVPMVHGAVAGYWGQVMTVFPGDPGLKALFGAAERLPRQGIESALGTPAGTAAMVAAWQVQEVVKLLTGRGRPLRQRLLWLDAEQGEAGVLALC